jgi:hypothetical protein
LLLFLEKEGLALLSIGSTSRADGIMPQFATGLANQKTRQRSIEFDDTVSVRGE